MRFAVALLFLQYVQAQEWRYYGGDAGGMKYSPLKQINKTNVASLKPAWTFHTGEISDGKTQLTRTSFEAMVLNPIRKFQALEGTNVPEMKPYSANITVNYAFQDIDWLKGVNVGGAYRWQDKNVVGYPVIRDPVTGLETEDVENPYYGGSEDTFDFWVGYTRRVAKNVTWRLRLGVRNAFYSKDLILTSVQPDGSYGAYRIPEPRVFSISNAFDF